MIHVVARLEPRISVNKLGEYLVANAGRRKTILREQKYAPAFMTTHYDDATRPILSFYADGCRPLIIKRHIDRLSKRVPKHDHDAQRLSDCMDALEAFLDLQSILNLSGYRVVVAPRIQPKMNVANVSVSVRPELLLYKKDDLVGAVKFQLSKSHALEAKSADYIATAVHQYVSETLNSRAAKTRDVFVVDVLSRNVRPAPAAIIQRRRDILAACEEIYARWSSIE